MRVARILLTIAGAVTALIGLLWIGQGTGVFPYPASSFMINQTVWIAWGAVLAVAGAAIVWAAQRLLGR